MKWMMSQGLELEWEWCIPHMTNAATKHAFGICPDRSRSKNPEMSDLIKKIVRTCFEVREVKKMGSLFSDIGQFLDGKKDSRTLPVFKSHRFLGLMQVCTVLYVLRFIIFEYSSFISSIRFWRKFYATGKLLKFGIKCELKMQQKKKLLHQTLSH